MRQERFETILMPKEVFKMKAFTKKEDLKQYPTAPSLVGKVVYLRPANPDDFAEVHRWFLISDPQMLSCRPIKIISPEERVDKMKKRPDSDEHANFIITAKENHGGVGHISYFNLNRLNRSAELGYLIAPDERKKGYAGDALETLIRYLFGEMDLNKVHAQTGSFNEASRKLLEGLGFHLDGTLRQHHLYRNELYDDLIYSLLRFECSFLK